MTNHAALVARWRLGAVILAAHPLAGGVSARVTALDVVLDGTIQRIVTREYGERDLAAKADVAAHEFALLDSLHKHGFPVPHPLHHERGVLLQTFAKGDNGAEVGADPVQLAHFLARLRGLELAGLPLRPLAHPTPNAIPDDALGESRIRAALAGLDRPPGRSVLLHGDLWPGNTLWNAGQLTAVLDWEDAARGDPLADVGNTRLELLFFEGWEAMTAFTNAYVAQTHADLTALPYWDLRAALRPCGRLAGWGLEPETERTLRERHRAFVEAALDAVDVR